MGCEHSKHCQFAIHDVLVCKSIVGKRCMQCARRKERRERGIYTFPVPLFCPSAQHLISFFPENDPNKEHGVPKTSSGDSMFSYSPVGSTRKKPTHRLMSFLPPLQALGTFLKNPTTHSLCSALSLVIQKRHPRSVMSRWVTRNKWEMTLTRPSEHATPATEAYKPLRASSFHFLPQQTTSSELLNALTKTSWRSPKAVRRFYVLSLPSSFPHSLFHIKIRHCACLLSGTWRGVGVRLDVLNFVLATRKIGV